jgi:hypothetical protein
VPFKEIKRGRNKGKFRSPSGRIYTKAQVRAYYSRKRSSSRSRSWFTRGFR